jgi:hypothetical protein
MYSFLYGIPLNPKPWVEETLVWKNPKPLSLVFLLLANFLQISTWKLGLTYTRIFDGKNDSNSPDFEDFFFSKSPHFDDKFQEAAKNIKGFFFS